jgi:hypothetical protein
MDRFRRFAPVPQGDALSHDEMLNSASTRDEAAHSQEHSSTLRHANSRTIPNADIEPVEFGAGGSLLNGTRPPSEKKTAAWGVHWLKRPLLLPFMALAGIALAVGHHFMYANLDGQVVSESNFSQEAVKQVGNAFVAFVLGAMKVAIDESYNQYVWTLVKRRSLQMKTLNKVFSLPSSFFSFLSFHLLKEAKIAYLLGTVSWYIPKYTHKNLLTTKRLLFLGGLTPAATLSIVPSLQSQPNSHRGVPLPDYTATPWSQQESVLTEDTVNPTALMLKVSTETAFNMAVLPPPAPAFNASFSVRFYGPTVQCNGKEPFLLFPV